MTPPNRDEKRKEERQEVPTTSLTPQNQPNNNEGLPQRQRDEGRETEGEGGGSMFAFVIHLLNIQRNKSFRINYLCKTIKQILMSLINILEKETE